MSSWIPSLPWFQPKKPEPSPAAAFVHEHMETIITLAISYFVTKRSPVVTTAGYLAGFALQVYLAKETTLDETKKVFMEITDEPKTTRNDLYRHVIPTIIGLYPPFQLLTDTMVGFSSGGISARKLVKYMGDPNCTVGQIFSCLKRASSGK